MDDLGGKPTIFGNTQMILTGRLINVWILKIDGWNHHPYLKHGNRDASQDHLSDSPDVCRNQGVQGQTFEENLAA